MNKIFQEAVKQALRFLKNATNLAQLAKGAEKVIQVAAKAKR